MARENGGRGTPDYIVNGFAIANPLLAQSIATFHKACAVDLSAHGLFLIRSAHLLLMSPLLVTSGAAVHVLRVASADNGDITRICLATLNRQQRCSASKCNT